MDGWTALPLLWQTLFPYLLCHTHKPIQRKPIHQVPYGVVANIAVSHTAAGDGISPMGKLHPISFLLRFSFFYFRSKNILYLCLVTKHI